jgi:AcrR family transcriptional regulator
MAGIEDGASRTRGRPVEINPSQLSRTAVELFAERGYHEVSATEIAAAAGVSRRSLFRYFPTKADLVWDGFEDSLRILAAALRDQGHLPPVRALLAAFLVMAERTPVLELTRTRLRILAAHAELVSTGLGRLDEQIALSSAYLRERAVDPLTARVQSSAITAAAFTGYLHWATETSDATPLPSVRRALDAVAGISPAPDDLDAPGRVDHDAAATGSAGQPAGA